MSHLGFLLYRVHIYYLLTRKPLSLPIGGFFAHICTTLTRNCLTLPKVFFSFPRTPFGGLFLFFYTFPLASGGLSLSSLSSLISLSSLPHTTCVSPSHITHIAHICTHPVCACFCVFVCLIPAKGEDNPSWEGDGSLRGKRSHVARIPRPPRAP